MIVDIPDAIDFQIAAENLINSAWNSLTKLLEEYETFDRIGADEPDKEKYWLYARPELTSAIAMVQQAVEFYLKSKILAISPYLLISFDTRTWPKKCDTSDVSFTEFRTLDAQDLLKVHNTVSSERLGNDFKQWFSSMRSMRNRIMHTVDKQLSIDPVELAVSILQGHEYLVGKNLWINTRISYLNRSPEHGVQIGTKNEQDAYIHMAIHREISLVVGKLQPHQVKHFFKYDKRSFSETCTSCYEKFLNCDFFDCKWTDPFIQTLQTIDKNHDELKCIVCGYTADISDVECEECGNRAIDKTTRECLWCSIAL
jgi:hypothetical protein